MSGSGEELIPIISQGLSSLYGDVLRTWSYDKLTLGWAIEQLVDRSNASDFVHKDCLTPFAYDRIESMLSQLKTPIHFSS